MRSGRAFLCGGLYQYADQVTLECDGNLSQVCGQCCQHPGEPSRVEDSSKARLCTCSAPGRSNPKGLTEVDYNGNMQVGLIEVNGGMKVPPLA